MLYRKFLNQANLMIFNALSVVRFKCQSTDLQNHNPEALLTITNLVYVLQLYVSTDGKEKHQETTKVPTRTCNKN